MDSSTAEMNRRLGSSLGAPECPVDVTVILPAFNEGENILGSYKQVLTVLDPLDLSYEIIFVDDGSTDDTWEQIHTLGQKDKRVRALRHRRNYGKASALANGFHFARGELIVTSDADMQYDPNDIVRLITKAREGYDVVSAYKVIRRDPLERRLPSKFFNFFVRSTTGVNLHDMNAGLKVFRQNAARSTIKYGYGELHRFFIVLAARAGYAVAEVPVESLPRPNGHSKYGMERYMRGALDYLTAVFLSGFAEKPLHLFGSAAVVLFGLSFAALASLVTVTLLSGWGGATVILLVMWAALALCGTQLLALGLVAEMINNLNRGSTGTLKVAQVMNVDRRIAFPFAPDVRVDRRNHHLDPDI
jgi:dolichol-phosphate mannosyltransferase